MKKLKCLIVDDEPVARDILSAYISRIPYLIEAGQCKNGGEALVFLQDEEVDILFLDIEMPDIKGLSIASAVSSTVQIIFTTAYREYAIDGFDLQIADYLLKPISFERFLKAVQRGKAIHSPSVTHSGREDEVIDSVFVRTDRKMVRVVYSDIIYLESLGDYVKIHLVDGRLVTIRETMNHLDDSLPANDFIRVHRSFIVRIDKIDSYTNEYIEVNSKMIPVSRSYRKAFVDIMG